NSLNEYNFQTLWMALNQRNYVKYLKASQAEKEDMRNSIIIGHILSFFRNMDIELQHNEQLMRKMKDKEKMSNYKGQKMMAFSGNFIVNALLPDGIGLGKSVSRGFGTIKKKE